MILLQRKNSFRTLIEKILRANERRQLDKKTKTITFLRKLTSFFGDSNMEQIFPYKYHKWGANKIMDIINKQSKSPQTLRLTENRLEKTKPGNLQFSFDSNLTRDMWVPRRPDWRRRDEVFAIDLELLFKNKERNKRAIFRVQRAERKHECREEPTKIHRNFVKHRGKRSSTPDSQFPLFRSEKLRRNRRND